MVTKYDKERNKNYAAGLRFTLTLETRVPSKYRIIDLETGEVWKAEGMPDGTTRWFSASDLEFKEKK